MAKKVLLKDSNDIKILPITRGELVLDSSGNEAFHSSEFLATTLVNGLMSAEDKQRIENLAQGGLTNGLILRINSGTNEGTSQYTYNGSTPITLNIKNGLGIGFTTNAGVLSIYNSGVRSVTTGTDNGTISVNTDGTSTNVSVKGLKSAAYTTSDQYVQQISVNSMTDIVQLWDNLEPYFGNTRTVIAQFKNDEQAWGHLLLKAQNHRRTQYGVDSSGLWMQGNVFQRWAISGKDTEDSPLTLNKYKIYDEGTLSQFTGATTSKDGALGLVKKPVKGDQIKYLKGDGTWSIVDKAQTLSSDGVTSSVFVLPYYGYSTLNTEFGTTGTANETYFKNYLKKLIKSHNTSNNKVGIGTLSPNSQHISLFRAYDLTAHTDGLPEHSSGFSISLEGRPITWGTSHGSWYYNLIAYKSEIPTKVSDLENDSGYVTGGPYLPLTGGSLKSPTYNIPLTLRGDGESYPNQVALKMVTKSGNAGYFIYNSDADWYVTDHNWQNTYKILHSGNYTSYTVKKDGTGASGTWNINISGDSVRSNKLICASFNTASEITADYTQWYNHAGCSDVSSMGYAAVLNVGYGNYRWWQIWNSRNDHQLYWRPEKADASDWADVHTLLDNYNYSNYTLSIISLLRSTDKLLSTKTWSVGATSKGDQESQSECPTLYGMYLSLQYDTSKNQGYQLFGDTWTDGRLYVRYRKAGDSNTTYNAWKQIAFSSDLPTKVSDLTNDLGFVTGGPYLPISGGTLTGTLTIEKNKFGSLIIYRKDSTNSASICFKNGNDVTLGYLGMNAANGSLFRFSADTTKSYKLWDADNDGSGSGLDADLLDGTHKADLLTDVSTSLSNNLSVTVGGTTKTITKLYASRLSVSSNTITSTSDDTTEKWGPLGTSIHSYGTKNQLTDQPSQYGFILNVSNHDKEVHQIWMTQNTGNLYHRGGNASGWSGTWRTILDSVNTHIKDGVITINGTTITPLTQHQSLDDYIKWNSTVYYNISKRSKQTDGNIRFFFTNIDNDSCLGLGYEKSTNTVYLTNYKGKSLVLTNNLTYGNDIVAYTTTNFPSNQINILTGYSKATSIGAITTTDSLNTALGKLEFKTDFIYNDLFGTDNDEVINKWSEIVNFIDSVKETETDILDTFVTRKTNQTITGFKTFQVDSYYNKFIIQRTSVGTATITFADSSEALGHLGVGASNGTYPYEPIYIDKSLNVNKIWHSANDGSESGLDADLLDGVHASGLFTALNNVNTNANPKSIGITIGGTSKYLKINHAVNSQVLQSTRYDDNDPKPNTTTGTTFQFSNLSDIGWHNVLTMKSYSDNNYTAAQLATPAGNPGKDSDYSGTIKWRQGRNSTWLNWKTILDSSNYTNYPVKNPYILTLQAGTFAAKTYDGSTAVTVNVPTHTSHLTNNSGFITINHTHSYASVGTVVFTPANSELTSADVLALTGGWSIKKGTWDYAGNGYIKAGDFGNIDLAGTSIITIGNGSAYTQLYITAPTQSGHSGITNEILFYNNHGTDYQPAWTRILTNRNYTTYTVKKDGTGATGTWGISITGNSATVTCSESTSNYDRPIVVTNKSNGLYYSTKTSLNYKTGNITAPTFTGNLIGNADTATKLNMTSVTTYNDLNPIGVCGYTNTSGDLASNGFTAGNTSAAIAWGKDNCKIIIAARAGQTNSEVYMKQYYSSWGDWVRLLHSGNTYIKDGAITINGTTITPVTSRGYIGTTAVQANSAAQALTGITNLSMNGTYNNNNKLYINSSGLIYPYSTSTRTAGVYGVYDSNKVGHVWSMGTGYKIADDGSSTNNMYGLVYFHTNWSNNATNNAAKRDNTLITEVSAYAGDHQIAFVKNGKVMSALGDGVWSRYGFIKNGSSNDYVLLGGGGHKVLSDFLLETEFADKELTSNLITIKKDLVVSKDWIDTGIIFDSTTFPTGTGSYMVQLSRGTNYIFTGYLTVIIANNVSVADSDEIILHGGGFDMNSHYYLRTVHDTINKVTKLQIARNSGDNRTFTFTFKFKKLI